MIVGYYGWPPCPVCGQYNNAGRNLHACNQSDASADKEGRET